jgi:hypothetical protein
VEVHGQSQDRSLADRIRIMWADGTLAFPDHDVVADAEQRTVVTGA